MKQFFYLLFVLSISHFYSQELNCNIIVDARQTGDENLQVFKTLETQLSEFVNNNSWTGRLVRPNEKIDCSMFININSYENDIFQGTIQIQSSRPIYNSSYNSLIYNFNDRNFSFRYQEYQNLSFNDNQFENNLVSVIAFHINMILGIDSDSFELNSGTQYFNIAQKISKKSALTLKIGKEAFYKQINMNLSDAYDYASNVMVENMLKLDAEEGIEAFINKRKPNWQDK